MPNSWSGLSTTVPSRTCDGIQTRTIASSSILPCSSQYRQGKSQSCPDPWQTKQGWKTGTPVGKLPPLRASSAASTSSSVRLSADIVNLKLTIEKPHQDMRLKKHRLFGCHCWLVQQCSLTARVACYPRHPKNHILVCFPYRCEIVQ